MAPCHHIFTSNRCSTKLAYFHPTPGTIDYLRRVRRRSIIQEALLEEIELNESIAYPDVWDTAWQSVKSSHIRKALMKIPTEQRLAIELAYFYGYCKQK